VIQRRSDGSEEFYRTWDEYRRGFGNKSNEFWLGEFQLKLVYNLLSPSDLIPLARGDTLASSPLKKGQI